MPTTSLGAAGSKTIAAISLATLGALLSACAAGGRPIAVPREGTLLCPTGGVVVVRNNGASVDVYAAGQDLPRTMLGTAPNGRTEFRISATAMTITAGSARIPAGRIDRTVSLDVACNRAP